MNAAKALDKFFSRHDPFHRLLNNDDLKDQGKEAADVLSIRNPTKKSDLDLALRELQVAQAHGTGGEPNRVNPEWWKGKDVPVTIETTKARRDPLPAILYQKLWIHEKTFDEDAIKRAKKAEKMRRKKYRGSRIDEEEDDDSDNEDESGRRTTRRSTVGDDDEEEEEEEESEEEESDVDSEEAEERKQAAQAKADAEKAQREAEAQRMRELNENPKLQSWDMWLRAREWRHELCDEARLEAREREKAKTYPPLPPTPDRLDSGLPAPGTGRNWFRVRPTLYEFSEEALKLQPKSGPSEDDTNSWWCYRDDFVTEVQSALLSRNVPYVLIDLKKAQKLFRKNPALAYAFRRHSEAVSIDGIRQLWSLELVQSLNALRSDMRFARFQNAPVRLSAAELTRKLKTRFPEPSKRRLPLRRDPLYVKPEPEKVRTLEKFPEFLEFVRTELAVVRNTDDDGQPIVDFDTMMTREGPDAVKELLMAAPPILDPPLFPVCQQSYRVQRKVWQSEAEFREEFGDRLARDLVMRGKVAMLADEDHGRYLYQLKPDENELGWEAFPPPRTKENSGLCKKIEEMPGRTLQTAGSMAASGSKSAAALRNLFTREQPKAFRRLPDSLQRDAMASCYSD